MSGNNEAGTTTKPKKAAQKPLRQTAVEKLTPEELGTLRLNEADAAQFEQLRAQIKRSREDLHAIEGQEAEDDDVHGDHLYAAQRRVSADTTAMVHFLAPRVMRLRDGEAKRKWRSFVTKLQKDSKAA